MRLQARLKKLKVTVRPRTCRTVPDDPVAFARGLLAGAFGPADLDPTHPNHTGWLTRVCVFLTTLTPEHQAWLKAAGIADPAANLDKIAALDAVMRRA